MFGYSDDEDNELGPLQQEWPFGGEGHSDDVPLPEGTECRKISKLLANVDHLAGEYSFGGRADTLPTLPGLVVKGVGPIAVPLTEEHATKLIAKSKKSPFGHESETKMDENVRNSWQLEPDQVDITNTQWSTGIQKLTATIAARLGYEGVTLSCQLYKMLIYGQGGHFVKHQDTEKEVGMIATLVVQLPSLHEGGDLVIYRGGNPLYRHDFGKADGSAGYFPHYAVHYADAEHSLETVTKGYRLVLVYSLCLPAKMVYLKKSHDKLLSDELAEAVGGMGADNESFALLLEHEYTEKSIGDLGVGALKGIDRARFSALKGANDVVPADKQLRFFIVELRCMIDYIGESGGAMSEWEEHDRSSDVRWYSKSGENCGMGRCIGLNFLNPGQLSFAALWRPHGKSTEVGYLGNMGNTKETEYSCYAITALPAAQSMEVALWMANLTVAAKCLQAQASVDITKLRELLDGAKADVDRVCNLSFQDLSELLVEAGDSDLVVFFLNNIFNRIDLSFRFSLEASLIPIVRKFSWDDIGPTLLRSFDEVNTAMGSSTVDSDSETALKPLSDEPNYEAAWESSSDESESEVATESSSDEFDSDTAMEMLFQIVDGIEEGAAQTALFKLAAERALAKSGQQLASNYLLPLISKWMIRLCGKQTFEQLATKFSTMNGDELEPVTDAFLENVGFLERGDGKCEAFGSVLAVRVKWLKTQIQALDEHFSWEMPNAEFKRDPQVQAFLRGPDVSTTTKGIVAFPDLQTARNYAAESMRKEQVNASFDMEAVEEDDVVFVKITKTRDRFLGRQMTLAKYTNELKVLVGYYDEVARGGPKEDASVEDC